MNIGGPTSNRQDGKKTLDTAKDQLGDSSLAPPPAASASALGKMLSFGEKEIHEALRGLSRALGEKGVQGAEIRILGSVALICAFPGSRRLTTDLDAICATPAFHAAALEVGEELQLPENWLNEDVRTYSRPSLEYTEQNFPGCENLKILILTPESLFAMKCSSSRDGQDQKDLVLLAGKLGLHSLKDAERIFERFYADEAIGELAMATLLEHCDGRYE